MDPQEVARLLAASSREALEAFKAKDIRMARHAIREAFTHYRNLARWMQRGGFRPKNLDAALDAFRKAQDTIAGFRR